MSRRSTPPPIRGYSGFQPPSDSTTYRDLLMFEERLKTNAMTLNRRKSRYQLFLLQLLTVIAFLFCEVVLQTSIMIIPYKIFMCKVLPEIYTDEIEIQLHPYITLGMLFVAVTTLFLFFASGMYSEKIGYANRYVPHANRALRNLNMYLNVRQKPLRSKLKFNPWALFFPRPNMYNTSNAKPRSPTPLSEKGESQNLSVRKASGSVPISPIPPTNNPRGELIFSSRVDRTFREGYERYRSTFEWRRQERERATYALTWIGRWYWPWNWWRKPLPPPPHAYVRGHSPASSFTRGRKLSSTGSTSSGSRRSTPSPMYRVIPKGGDGDNAGVPPR